MAETPSQYRSYKPGDTVSLTLRLEDPSGVADVRANFTLASDTTKQMYFYAHGDGHAVVDVVLQQHVTEGTAPGDYYCFQLDVSDTIGNRRVYSDPGIGFRVEAVPGDHEGPEFKGWSYGN